VGDVIQLPKYVTLINEDTGKRVMVGEDTVRRMLRDKDHAEEVIEKRGAFISQRVWDLVYDYLRAKEVKP
jgi:hypothetical protein